MASIPFWFKRLAPAPMQTSLRERLYGSVGALVGLLITDWVGHQALGGFNPWFIAPMGASAVLLFAAPASPLAQPWSIVGGNIVSAVVGVTCYRYLGDSGFAPAAAVALAIAAMFALRCLHPPGGAVALTAVMGGPAVKELGFGFVLSPVAFNSVVLVAVALLFNALLRRQHLRRPAPNLHRTSDPRPSERVGVQARDVQRALREQEHFVDVDPSEVEEIARAAQRRASKRHFADLRCGDIMSRDVVSIGADQPLEQAWRLLGRHRLQALPVVDRRGELVGIVSLRDVVTHQAGRDEPDDWKHLSVSTCMTREVLSVVPSTPVSSLVRPLSDGGLHQIPVLDASRQVVGTITQSDMVAALYGMMGEAGAPPLQKAEARKPEPPAS